MEIILNEKLYAEKLIETETVHPAELYYDVNILVRYLYSTGLNRDEIYEHIKEFMKKACSEFDINLWYRYIDRYINKAKKRDLFEIEYVPITQNELDKIKEVNDPKKERVLFTLLTVAKLNNLKSQSNNNWVNYDDKFIFELARVSCSSKNRNLMLYEFKEAGYIRNSKKALSLNIRVNFIDEEGEPVLKITDMRELGYQYQELEKEPLIRRCIKCDKRFRLKGRKDRTRLCLECRKPELLTATKIKHCEFCHEEFTCFAKDNKSTLCPACQAEVNREIKRAYIQKKRASDNM